MNRLVLAAALGVFCTGDALAQCGRWQRPNYAPVYVPIYSAGPNFWGTPAPAPLPPAPKPFVPKAGVGVHEDSEPAPKPRDVSKEKELPKIPKPKLPIPPDPDEKPSNVKPPKFETPKKEPQTNAVKAIEQFIVPLDENSKPSAEVRVGFFNHSDREITLDVNGEAVKLPSEQYVTVRTSRTFTWSEKGQKGTDVVVPPDAEGIEIVFRK